VLLFEFFPLFVALVGAVAAVFLFLKDRRSRSDPDYMRQPEGPKPGASDERSGRRPSMMP
jgi:hypothetical protein